jgi:hypothetical protein
VQEVVLHKLLVQGGLLVAVQEDIESLFPTLPQVVFLFLQPLILLLLVAVVLQEVLVQMEVLEHLQFFHP